MSPATAIEVAVLAAGTGLLLWSSFTRRHNTSTLSGLFWSLRDRLGTQGRMALAAGVTGGLGYLWWHLLFG